MGMLLLILALVCCLIAVVGEPYWPRVRVGWLGMAFFIAYFLFAQGHVC
jgi:hypothetical protein